MAKSNINAARIMTGGDGQLNINNMTVEAQTVGNPPVFQKAVVQEVIYNPKDLTEEDKARLKSSVSNPNAVDQIAANSIIAVLISDGMSQAITTRVILFPYFQSHFMLPIQAGEQVSVVFEDFQKDNFLAGRWITRISEGLQTEDLNFTHGDRRYNKINFGGERTSSSLARTSGSYTPFFPNGAGQQNTFTLPQGENSTNPYDLIYRTASASLMHSYEVVPRWTKRPQEFVLQGMNNSLIMIGQDRVGSVSNSDTGSIDQKKYAGTVDIVTGRSRYLLLDTDNEIAASLKGLKGTSPFVVTNSRGLEEVDKTPRLNSRVEQVKEGDPDFIHDAARIYVSMKTLGDTNFKLAKTNDGNALNALQTTGINYPTSSLYPVQFLSTSNKIGSSYVIGKADHIRMVARRSVPTEQPTLSGSILLLKEGNNRTPEDINTQTAPQDHLAYLYMSPEGRVQIDGMQIFLGGSALRVDNQAPPPDVPLNPEGSNSAVEVGTENLLAGTEPYIKWSEYKNTVENLQQQIKDLRDAYSGLVDDIGGLVGRQVCTPFGPDSGWPTLYGKSQTRRSQLDSSLQDHRTKTNQAVYKSRSSKIFGQ